MVTKSTTGRKPEPGVEQDFATLAQGKSPGLAGELIQFLRYNKKWWMTPILLILALLGAIVGLGGTAAAPWIYTLF